MRQKRTPSALLLRNLGPGLLFVRPRWAASLFGDDVDLSPDAEARAFEVPPGATYLADPGDLPGLPAAVLLECSSPQNAPATLAWAPDVDPEAVSKMRFVFLSPAGARVQPQPTIERLQTSQIRRRFALTEPESVELALSGRASSAGRKSPR